MEEMKPFIKTQRYAICPNCNQPTSTVDHLIDKNTETRWYCDGCGYQYELKFENGKMFIGKTNKKEERTLVLLRAGHIALVVEGIKFVGEKDDNGENHDEYFYNSHTCPVNYMKDVRKVIDLRNMNEDPHGIFEYVGTVPYDERIENQLDLRNLVDIFRTDLLNAPQGETSNNE